MISIRPQDTVRDLIKKCIDTSHLQVRPTARSRSRHTRLRPFIRAQNSSVDDYVLYVLNDAAPAINPPLQANPTQLIPLIGTFRSRGSDHVHALRLPHVTYFDTERAQRRRKDSISAHVTSLPQARARALVCTCKFFICPSQFFLLPLVYFFLLENHKSLLEIYVYVYTRNQQFAIRLSVAQCANQY